MSAAASSTYEPAADPRSWNKSEAAAAASALAADPAVPFRFFALGLFFFAAFAVALAMQAPHVLTQHHYTHEAVALTHALVLGWIGSIVLGATIQLVPVALGEKLHNQKIASLVLPLYALGIVGMIASFWFWNFRFVLWFGSLVTLALGLHVYNVARTLAKMPRHDAVSIHVATSLFYLALTFLAGQYLMHDKVAAFSPFHVLSAIHAHAHLAALGWFVMLIVGVSYRLIPMFALSEIQSRRRVWTAYALLNAGILSLFVALLTGARWTPLAAACVVAALGLWIIEIGAMLRARKRPHFDGALRQACAAMAHLVLAAGIGIWLCLPAEPTPLRAQAQTSYGLIALLGFVSLFVMAMLYKIIPFLVWYKIYTPLIGLRPTPKLYELYSLRLQRWSLALFLGGLWVTAALTLRGEAAGALWLQSGAGLLAAGILLFVWNMAACLSRLLRRIA